MNLSAWQQLADPIVVKSLPKISTDAALGNVFGAVLTIAGIVSVLLIIIGGIMYSVSLGDPSKISKAKDTILYAIVGLVVVALSFLIIQLVVGIF